MCRGTRAYWVTAILKRNYLYGFWRFSCFFFLIAREPHDVKRNGRPIWMVHRARVSLKQVLWKSSRAGTSATMLVIVFVSGPLKSGREEKNEPKTSPVLQQHRVLYAYTSARSLASRRLEARRGRTHCILYTHARRHNV